MATASLACQAASAKWLATLRQLVDPEGLACGFWVVCILLAVVLTAFPALDPLTKYGKSSVSASAASPASTLANLKVQKSYFIQYYITAFVLGLCAFFGAALAAGDSWQLASWAAAVPAQDVVVLLWLCHLARRWAECTFVHRWSDATMHLVVLVVGLLHYAAATLSLLLARPSDDCATAAAPLRALLPRADLAGTSLQQALFWCGVACMLVSQVGQHVAHVQLASLRSDPPPPGVKVVGKYALPSGGMFWLSSSPHYTAEIAIYVGLALLGGGTAPLLLLVVWVATNLSLTATATHAWYARKFDCTPSPWRILPGVW